MRSIAIFGKGGHARVIASLLGQDVMFIGRESEETFFREIDKHRKSEIYLGIGDDEARRKIFERLSAFGIMAASCVAPTAFIAKTASIGAGTVICPGAVVMAGARIEDNVIINTLSSVDHDTMIGTHTQISVGVSIPGDVKTGTQCFFGVKSATFPGVSLGDHVIVRAGSLVTKDVPSNVMVGGSPAEIIRQVRP